MNARMEQMMDRLTAGIRQNASEAVERIDAAASTTDEYVPFAGWDRSTFMSCHRAVLDILMALPPGRHWDLSNDTISNLAMLAAELTEATEALDDKNGTAGGES